MRLRASIERPRLRTGKSLEAEMCIRVATGLEMDIFPLPGIYLTKHVQVTFKNEFWTESGQRM
jgi:hypothetical protein